MVIILAWLLFVGALTFAVIRFSGLLDSMLLAGEPADIRFGPDMELPKSANYFVICPHDACPKTHRRAPSPDFKVAPDVLATALQGTANAFNMHLIEGDALSLEFRFLTRTPIMRFPDWVDIKVVPNGQGGSRIFAYSRSVYGNDDFGKNEKRLKSWMAAAIARMSGATSGQTG